MKMILSTQVVKSLMIRIIRETYNAKIVANQANVLLNIPAEMVLDEEGNKAVEVDLSDQLVEKMLSLAKERLIGLME